MSLETFALYIITIFVVIVIPGPLSLFMVTNTLRHGIWKSYPAFVGGTLASSLYLIVSASGVGVLIIASPRLFLILKLLGAFYLIYLGIATIRSARKLPAAVDSLLDTPFLAPKFFPLFKKAFLLGASNPKDILFFVAFLPQFISTQGHLIAQITLIVATWIGVDILCKLLYGGLAKSIRPVFNTHKKLAAFDGATGGLYIAAGVAAAVFG